MFDGLTSRGVRDKFTLLARISLVFWATELDTIVEKTVQNYSGVFPTSEIQFTGSEMSKRGRFLYLPITDP